MRNVFVLLIFAAMCSSISADYYLVEPEGDVYRAVKTPKGYERLGDETIFFRLASAYLDTIW